VFLALSLLFKNPIVPGVVIMGWEAIAPIFPAWAQRLSVTFYLKHLCPVSLPLNGPLAIFTIVAEPVSPFIAVLGLLCLTIAILALSCLLIHRMEITYTAEEPRPTYKCLINPLIGFHVAFKVPKRASRTSERGRHSAVPRFPQPDFIESAPEHLAPGILFGGSALPIKD
jgi:hypothetical protein